MTSSELYVKTRLAELKRESAETAKEHEELKQQLRYVVASIMADNDDSQPLPSR